MTQQITTELARDTVRCAQGGEIARRVEQRPHDQGTSDQNQRAGDVTQWRVVEQ